MSVLCLSQPIWSGSAVAAVAVGAVVFANIAFGAARVGNTRRIGHGKFPPESASDLGATAMPVRPR